ncbi:MAG TPA: cell division protein FtsQ/DivIB [Gallionella sp.]
MWDDPRLLRSIANLLYMLCALMLLYATAHYTVHMSTLLPVHSVRLAEMPQRVAAAQVLQVARTEVRGNLLTVDIQRVRESLEKLPWVRKVGIRREFPGSLVVDLEEHQALARWNGSMLVNRFGEVFVAVTDQALPEFEGAEGTSAEVTAHFEQFTSQLVGVGLEVAKISLSARHAWQLRLSNGVVLELGREDMQNRLARFVEVYPYGMAAQGTAVKYVDLRYRNGFAVSGQVNQG